jgi:SAM-dependent methyltransferase
VTSAPEPGDDFGRGSWERRWSQALSKGAHAGRPPNAHLLAEVVDLRPGRALDAGAGHGAEAIWLAAHGWEVTAVDFAMTALDHARSTAEALGGDVAGRIEWIAADLGTWAPPPDAYDLVACLFVHIAGSVPEMVQRLAAGVATGGTLVLLGHRPAPGQVQVSVEDVVGTLGPDRWQIVVGEERPRANGNGVDAVVCARRR